jgi:hypothetical protein
MVLAARKMVALVGLTLGPLSMETATPNAYGQQTAPKSRMQDYRISRISSTAIELRSRVDCMMRGCNLHIMHVRHVWRPGHHGRRCCRCGSSVERPCLRKSYLPRFSQFPLVLDRSRPAIRTPPAPFNVSNLASRQHERCH